MALVERRYGKSQLDFERFAVVAVSSVYGIDILSDNIRDCRRRLFEAFEANYTRLFKAAGKNKCREAVRFILERNNREPSLRDYYTFTTLGCFCSQSGLRTGPLIFTLTA